MTDSVTWKGENMSQLINKFKNWIMSFTCDERRNKQLQTFRDEFSHYSSIDKVELNYEYINCKVEYEHKKNILTLIVVTIAVSLIINIWGKMFSFLNMAIKYDNYLNDTQDTFIVCLVVATVIVLTFMIVIIYILHKIFNNLKQLKQQIELIEYVKAEEENEN